ncbi:MAG: hypothetical protein HC862_28395 [Scytonema sp. RU_4_4]|nr:hypothetical protein [Scytonema sp. RU_4_4]NJR72662.1 hypothetical protein [Scytonema sp. CRU_2_7]
MSANTHRRKEISRFAKPSTIQGARLLWHNTRPGDTLGGTSKGALAPLRLRRSITERDGERCCCCKRCYRPNVVPERPVGKVTSPCP